jgi:hypothetical protein
MDDRTGKHSAKDMRAWRAPDPKDSIYCGNLLKNDKSSLPLASGDIPEGGGRGTSGGEDGSGGGGDAEFFPGNKNLLLFILWDNFFL